MVAARARASERASAPDARARRSAPPHALAARARSLAARAASSGAAAGSAARPPRARVRRVVCAARTCRPAASIHQAIRRKRSINPEMWAGARSHGRCAADVCLRRGRPTPESRVAVRSLSLEQGADHLWVRSGGRRFRAHGGVLMSDCAIGVLLRFEHELGHIGSASDELEPGQSRQSRARVRASASDPARPSPTRWQSRRQRTLS